MFSCQNFLQQICSKFYKEQKLFYGHLMKMLTTSSKVTHNAKLGLFSTLRNFQSVESLQFARGCVVHNHVSNVGVLM